MTVRAYKFGRLHTTLLRQGYKAIRYEEWDSGTWAIMEKPELTSYHETGQLTNAELAWFLDDYPR